MQNIYYFKFLIKMIFFINYFPQIRSCGSKNGIFGAVRYIFWVIILKLKEARRTVYLYNPYYPPVNDHSVLWGTEANHFQNPFSNARYEWPSIFILLWKGYFRTIKMERVMNIWWLQYGVALWKKRQFEILNLLPIVLYSFVFIMDFYFLKDQ